MHCFVVVKNLIYNLYTNELVSLVLDKFFGSFPMNQAKTIVWFKMLHGKASKKLPMLHMQFFVVTKRLFIMKVQHYKKIIDF